MSGSAGFTHVLDNQHGHACCVYCACQAYFVLRIVHRLSEPVRRNAGVLSQCRDSQGTQATIYFSLLRRL